MIPKLAAVAAISMASFFAAIDFSTTINLGAILVGSLILVIGGFFSIRANAANNWRTNYFAEKERAENAVNAEKEQRELKHQYMSEVQGLKMKTDLTPALALLKDLLEAHQSTMANNARIAEALQAQTDVLSDISAAMKRLHPDAKEDT